MQYGQARWEKMTKPSPWSLGPAHPGWHICGHVATAKTWVPLVLLKGKRRREKRCQIHLSDGRNMGTPLLWGMETVHNNYIPLDAHVSLCKNERQQIRCLFAKWEQKLTLKGVSTGKSVLINHILWIALEKKWRTAVILSTTFILVG